MPPSQFQVPLQRRILKRRLSVVREEEVYRKRFARREHAVFVWSIQQNARRRIEDRELLRGESAALLAPERIEEPLCGVRLALLHDDVYDRPEAVAVAILVLARPFHADLLVVALQCVLRVLQAVAPRGVQPGLREPRRARFARRRRKPHARVVAFAAGVELYAEVQVFVRHEGTVRTDRAPRPFLYRPAAVVGGFRRIDEILVAVLVYLQPVGVHRLDVAVQRRVEARAERALVPHGVDGERRVAAVVPPQLRNVAPGVEGEVLGGHVAVVRQLRLDHHTELVGGLEVLWQFAMRVEAHEVEAGGAGLPKVSPVHVAVGRGDSAERIHVVVAEAPHVERLAIEEELRPADLELAHAEALSPDVDHLPVLDKVHLRRVEVRMFRRPGAQFRKRNFQGEG